MSSVDRPAGLAAAVSVSPRTASPVLSYQRTVPRAASLQRRADRWNFFCNMLDGAFAILAGQLLGPVLPVFLSEVGLSDTRIGLLNALGVLAVIPMPIVGAWLVRHMRRRKPFVVGVGVVQRTHLFLVAAFAGLLLPRHGGLFLGLYIASYLINQAANQVNGPAWTDLVGKVIPPGRRASLFAWRGNLGILPPILCAGLVSWVLYHYTFPHNYALLFLMSAICFALSLVFIVLIREPAGVVEGSAAQRDVHPLRDLPQLLARDHHYRWFLIAQAFTTLAGSMVGIFYLLTVKDRFGVDPKAVLAQSMVVSLSCLFVGNIVFAWIGDRYGHKRNLITSIVLSMAACLWAVLAANTTQYTLVFMLSGLASAAAGVSGMPMLMEFGGERHRSKYAAIQSTLLGPVGLVGPWIGGLLRDHASLKVSFGSAMALSMVGMSILVLCVPNPGKRAIAPQAG